MFCYHLAIWWTCGCPGVHFWWQTLLGMGIVVILSQGLLFV